MDVTVSTCPVCGAPLKWGGQITLPEEDERAGEPALYFTWTCGHEVLVQVEDGAGDHDQPYSYRAPSAEDPGPFSRTQYLRLLLLRDRARAGAFADDGGGDAAEPLPP